MFFSGGYGRIRKIQHWRYGWIGVYRVICSELFVYPIDYLYKLCSLPKRFNDDCYGVPEFGR